VLFRSIDKLVTNQYDLILLDLKMPDVSGHDVMNFMSSNNITTMTIVVSGETSMDDVSKALRHGAYDYLKKPYIPEQLTATVKNAVRKKLLEKSNQVMQKKLNQSERLHRFIVNNSPDIIMILDKNGLFCFFNSKIESLLNFGKIDLVGKHISSIVEDEDLEKENYFFEYALSGKAGIQSMDLALKSNNPGHSKRHFELSLCPIEEQGKTNVNGNQR